MARLLPTGGFSDRQPTEDSAMSTVFVSANAHTGSPVHSDDLELPLFVYWHQSL